MPLDICAEEPAPLHGTRFGLEQDRVLDVLKRGDEEFVFGLLRQCCTSIFSLVWVIDNQPHFAHDEP